MILLGLAGTALRPTPTRAQEFTPVTDPVKNDVLVLRNGDTITGEFRQLQRGIVTFKTDAASTIYIKWPRVITATTDKTFEIVMADGSTHVGSLPELGEAGRLGLQIEAGTLDVASDSVVEMVRIKKTFWERLDGNVSAGLDFTQQESKLDLNLSTSIDYNVAHNRFGLDLSGTFTRQDAVDDIRRGGASALYAREISKAWLWAGGADAQSNSQLSLDYAWSVGTGPGRYLVRTNRVMLATWLGLFYRTEQYEGESQRNTLPLSLTTDFQWFVWSGLSTDVSSRLVVSPILDDSGRWQISFTSSLSRELVSSLYLSIGITEIYDSRPPTDANKNDFSFTSSLGWNF
ncbi:MAG: DUF481 domain-containing protein [marine benthic group bacterium]|jgi:hypothetical protein|nr:DUF481 domain-containing protein [Candidatus Carthagonibacter metallireducens]MCL7966003.1 DUF481 domain-containing protein [Gemmatimonadota bacterium]MCL7983024.1 DUF481 domain-containing protein [Gemmatimonadota bacterium]MCL7986279.1 DUF481 domain-containing protein [Gemmatimonadota bacterium]